MKKVFANKKADLLSLGQNWFLQGFYQNDNNVCIHLQFAKTLNKKEFLQVFANAKP